MPFSTTDVNRTATKVQRPKAEGYNARIGDLWFRTAEGPESPIAVGLRDSLAPRTDTQGSIYENVLELGYAWARTELDGGEGLDWDPPKITRLQEQVVNASIRYYDSGNINVEVDDEDEDTGPYAAKLSKAVEPLWPTYQDVEDLTSSAQYLYLARGNDVEWYNQLASPTPTGSFTFPSPVKRIIAARNDTVAALLDNGDLWLKPSNEDTFALTYDSPTDGAPIQEIWWVKGRLICSRTDPTVNDPHELGEYGFVESGLPGSPVVVGSLDVFDTIQGPIYWVIDGGPAIVAACDDGTLRSYVSEIVQVAGGLSIYELVIKGRFQMPIGEIPIGVGYNVGVLGVLSRNEEDIAGNVVLRYYEGTVLDARFDFVVGNLQQRRTWTNSPFKPEERHPTIRTRDSLLFPVRESDGSSYMWSHLTTTRGLSRTADVGTNPIQTLTNFAGRWVALESGKTLIYESSLYQPDGYIIFPNMTFGLNTPINWIATVLEGLNFDEPGVKIELYRSAEPDAITDRNHPSWVWVRTLNSQVQSGREQVLFGVESRTLALKVEFSASLDGTVSPLLTRTAIRGIPKHRDFILQLPINVSDLVEVPGRQPYWLSGWGHAVHETLFQLAGEFVEVQVLDPPFLFQGVIDSFNEPTTYVTARGSVSERITLLLRGSQVGSQAASSGTEGLGIGLLGVELLGVNT